MNRHAAATEEAEELTEEAPKVALHRRGENVSFIAQGDMGPIRIITRPTDDVFEGHKDYEKRVVDAFADYGITVTEAEVKQALTS